MPKIRREDLVRNVPSRYKLVILASLRTLELSEGKEKLVDVPPNTKFAMIALKEIEQGAIGYKIKEMAEKKEAN